MPASCSDLRRPWVQGDGSSEETTEPRSGAVMSGIHFLFIIDRVSNLNLEQCPLFLLTNKVQMWHGHNLCLINIISCGNPLYKDSQHLHKRVIPMLGAYKVMRSLWISILMENTLYPNHCALYQSSPGIRCMAILFVVETVKWRTWLEYDAQFL